MSTFVYEGGRGGQKSPKNRPRGLCMPPKGNLEKKIFSKPPKKIVRVPPKIPSKIKMYAQIMKNGGLKSV